MKFLENGTRPQPPTSRCSVNNVVFVCGKPTIQTIQNCAHTIQNCSVCVRETNNTVVCVGIYVSLCIVCVDIYLSACVVCVNIYLSAQYRIAHTHNFCVFVCFFISVTVYVSVFLFSECVSWYVLLLCGQNNNTILCTHTLTCTHK